MTRLQGGANNVVARVEVDGRPLVAKLYFAHPGDPRDRLQTEFATLTFLWRNDVRCVPEPVAVDREHQTGIYEYVDGTNVAPGEVAWPDALQLADLLAAMWALRSDAEAARLPAASEAHFTVRAYLEAMERRLERVRATLADVADGGNVLALVEDEVVPCACRLRRFVEERAASLSLDLDLELPVERRTLSPADFGFHNVLRRPDGRLAFLDFEYAGWDDPAVVLAQACIAPAVPLPREARLPLLRHLLDRFGDGGEIAARLRVLYPLVALKWSLIALNDFLPVSRERREFASTGELGSRAGQIPKSRGLLREVDEALSDDSFLDELLGAASGGHPKPVG